MPKYSRLKPKIEDIPLESAINVFKFLKLLLKDKSLNLDYFKTQCQKSSIAETYFLIYYSMRYFEYGNPKSYLRVHLDEINNSMQMFDGFISYKYKIKSNSEKLYDYCSTHIVRARSLYLKSLINGVLVDKKWIAFDKSNLYDVINIIISNRAKNKNKGFDSVSMESIRIPLNIRTSVDLNKSSIRNVEMNGVFDEFKNLFSSFLSNEDFKKLSNNTFRIYNGDNSMTPLELLDLKCINKSDLYDRIYKLYAFYKRDAQNEMRVKYEKDVKKFNDIITSFQVETERKVGYSKEEIQVNINNKKKELYVKIGLKNKFKYKSSNCTKYDFICAFFFSFPVIRESYLNWTKLSNFSNLPEYLRVETRNLKTRK